MYEVGKVCTELAECIYRPYSETGRFRRLHKLCNVVAGRLYPSDPQLQTVLLVQAQFCDDEYAVETGRLLE